ncbi:hypothetical protein [Methanobrevibacter sp.]
MRIKDKAKKISRVILFIKLYEKIRANKEPILEDLTKLKELLDEWKAESPEDLNQVLASILVKFQEGSVEDVDSEFEQAKEQYQAEDEEMVPWFESQVEYIRAQKEKEAGE